MRYKFTRAELKQQKASNFQEGDVIEVSKYYIYIKYIDRKGIKWDHPSWASVIENRNTYKLLDCTPGAGRPYYLDDFLHR